MFGRQTPTNKRAAIRPAQKCPGRGLRAGMRQDRWRLCGIHWRQGASLATTPHCFVSLSTKPRASSIERGFPEITGKRHSGNSGTVRSLRYKITWQQNDFENVSTHENVNGERRKLTNSLITCSRRFESILIPRSFWCQHHHKYKIIKCIN
jgi:hypothetical protein